MATLHTMSLRAFDKGVMETLGAVLANTTVDGELRSHYVRTFSGVSTNIQGFNGAVPFFFAMPEDVYQAFVLPCVLIRRTAYTPAFERATWYGYERAPDVNANPIVVTRPDGSTINGYDAYAEKLISTPMNIGYDVQVLARTQSDFLMIFQTLMMTMRPPFFTFGAIDTGNCLRHYDAGPVSLSDTSELSSIGDRTISSTISFEVQGEIDYRYETNTIPPLTDLPNVELSPPIYREE
tara:strand:+ start:2114 stop:2824 length:711 start_codon:yes stop_codon:yes gene_type:complete